MKTKASVIFILILVTLLVSACDARRNQILNNLLVSPTMTDTPAPPTETPVPTNTSTPTPTPTPFLSVENSELLLIGDFDPAEYNLKATVSSDTNATDVLQARVNLMELSYLREEYSECLNMINDVIDSHNAIQKIDANAVLGKAYYLYAQCAAETGAYNAEIEGLSQYIHYRPETPILTESYQEIAYAYRSLEDYEMFRQYIDKIETNDEEPLNEYIQLDYAVSFALDGDNDEAVKRLTDLYNNSTDESIKAAADYYLGTDYEAMGLRDQVIARYQDAVNSFPRSYYSYLALVWLLDNDQTVSDYQRGLINYYVGQYALANDAFRRYVKTEPGNDGSSWYFIGVCLMNLANYDGAEKAFTKLIEEYPSNRYYVPSWDELAYVQWAGQSRHRKAAETLTNYVSLHPDQADSASFLFEAGRILERGNYLSDAAKTWGRLIDEYPLYENSKYALFLAAISSYRIGDYETSLAYLNRLLLVSGIPEDQAQANFWIAKIYQKKNDSYNASKYLERASSMSKTGYYSLRASELAEGKAYLFGNNAYDLDIDLAAERQVADQWMMLTFGIDLDSLDDSSLYQDDPDYLKGCEYYDLGEYQQATILFEETRNKLTEQPAASYAFLDEMVQKQIYSVAAYTSRQILTSAGLYEDDRTLDVPNYFNHIRFGYWFSNYVTDACSNYSLSPFLLYAIMKQESMYNPWVYSAAGARGLMQIMPETGAEIARTLHWPPNYTVSDLNRAPISINFAASYLKRLNSYFDQSNAAMLAAYNGGSGNTQRWLNISDDDPDLLFEVIRFEETRNYLNNIYRNAKIYEWLYAK